MTCSPERFLKVYTCIDQQEQRYETTRRGSRRPREYGNVLYGYGIIENSTLELLSNCAHRAKDLTPKQLPLEIQKWFSSLRHEPLRIFISLSRAHISNWFSAKSPEDAYCSFISAHCALQKGRDLPELRQNPSLGKYLD